MRNIIKGIRLSLMRDLLNRILRSILSTAQNADRFVDEDSHQPTSKSAVVLKPSELAVSQQETVLYGIFGFFMVVKHAVRKAVE